MRNWIRTIGWILLTVAATYVICEWAVWQKILPGNSIAIL